MTTSSGAGRRLASAAQRQLQPVAPGGFPPRAVRTGSCLIAGAFTSSRFVQRLIGVPHQRQPALRRVLLGLAVRAILVGARRDINRLAEELVQVGWLGVPGGLGTSRRGCCGDRMGHRNHDHDSKDSDEGELILKMAVEQKCSRQDAKAQSNETPAGFTRRVNRARFRTQCLLAPLRLCARRTTAWRLIVGGSCSHHSCLRSTEFNGGSSAIANPETRVRPGERARV